jgi:hypothetical protein
MGRASLLMVMGLGVVFAIIGMNMRGTTSYLVTAEMGYAKYSMARNMARMAVHATLRYAHTTGTCRQSHPADR